MQSEDEPYIKTENDKKNILYKKITYIIISKN